jgi:hypothetical protein
MTVELFWRLIGRKYKLERVVEREGEERFGVANLKVVYEGLVNDLRERGGREVVQERELGTGRQKSLLECAEKNVCK